MREGRDTPSGSKGTKKRKWYLMDAMEFLRDFVGIHRKMDSSISEGSPPQLPPEETDTEGNSVTETEKTDSFPPESPIIKFV